MMTQLSGGAIVALMHQAGFPPDAWRVGAALAYAESSWRTDLTNTNTDSNRSTDLGLWQINDYWHPTEIASGDWRNPLDNTRMAYRLYSKSGAYGGWRTWVAYTTGRYRQHLSKADQALREHEMAHRAMGESHTGSSSAADENLSRQSGGPTGPEFQTAGWSDSTNQLATAVETMTAKSTWVRIGMGVLGAILVGYGLFQMVKSLPGFSKLQKTVNSAVLDVIPGGGLAKKVGKKAKRGSKSAVDKAKESVKEVAESGE